MFKNRQFMQLIFSPLIKFKNELNPNLNKDANYEGLTQKNNQNEINKFYENIKNSNEDTFKNYFLPSFIEDLPGKSLNGLIAKEEAHIFKSYLQSDFNLNRENIKETNQTLQNNIFESKSK
jgi:hypothetical protein